jgi:hypothetical protein
MSSSQQAPVGETTAKLALQPLVNLARLDIRDGDAGYQLVEFLYDGTRAPGPRQTSAAGPSTSLLSSPPGNPRKAIVQWFANAWWGEGDRLS